MFRVQCPPLSLPPPAAQYHQIQCRRTLINLGGARAQGSACLWRANGGLRAATFFAQGVVDNTTTAHCSAQARLVLFVRALPDFASF